MKKRISIIVAMDEKRGIGKENRIPWHLKADLVRLKKMTLGHATILGRSSFESMLGYYEKSGRPTMKQRPHIVLTRDKKYTVKSEYGTAAYSVQEALKKANEIEKEEIFVIGGAKIFEQMLPYADRLYLTMVHGEYDVDTFFPAYPSFTRVVEKEEKEEDGMKYTFLTLEKEAIDGRR